MANRDAWLNQAFLLSDHPFEPMRDPVHGLDLRGLRISLSRSLDVFTTKELADYFAQVGSIEIAVGDVSAFLNGMGYSIDNGTPPVLLIEGQGGTGRKTLGNFVAHLMKAHCFNPPSLQLLRVTTNHFGRLLLEIRYALETHFKRLNLDTTSLASRDALIKSEDPDETVLAGLFSNLAQQNLGLAMLILLIDPLEYRNFDWIGKLHAMLKDLNVALVFLTKDDLVTERFAKALGRGEYIGCVLRVGPLNMQDGLTLLGKRLSLFRQTGAPLNLAPLTPYEMAAVQWVFTGGTETRTIKILLNLCRVALNLKLADLQANAGAPQPGTSPPRITEADLQKAYQTVLQQASWGGPR